MKRQGFLGLTAIALICALGAQGALAGDAAKGKKVYRKCKTCHEIDKEKNKIGPHLVGILGRAAGSLDGFKYSDAMKSSGIVWDAKTIDAYVANPKEYIPGNKMAFVGVKKEDQRADLIAYIEEVAGK